MTLRNKLMRFCDIRAGDLICFPSSHKEVADLWYIITGWSECDPQDPYAGRPEHLNRTTFWVWGISTENNTNERIMYGSRTQKLEAFSAIANFVLYRNGEEIFRCAPTPKC